MACLHNLHTEVSYPKQLVSRCVTCLLYACSSSRASAGSDDFGGDGYSFPSGGGSGAPPPASSVLELQPQRTLQQVGHQ